MDRLNPVTLITGAASGVGAPCVREMARRSQGGLVLVDLDDASLCAVADDLEKENVAPERVSTLAFDVADEERWMQATDFIEAQYGRLDWAVLYAGMPKTKSDLLDFRRPGSLLDSAARGLRALTPLIGKNRQGGAAVINAAAEYPDPASPVREVVARHRSWFRDTLLALVADAGLANPVQVAGSLVLLRDAALVGGYLDGADEVKGAFLASASAITGLEL